MRGWLRELLEAALVFLIRGREPPTLLVYSEGDSKAAGHSEGPTSSLLCCPSPHRQPATLIEPMAAAGSSTQEVPPEDDEGRAVRRLRRRCRRPQGNTPRRRSLPPFLLRSCHFGRIGRIICLIGELSVVLFVVWLLISRQVSAANSRDSTSPQEGTGGLGTLLLVAIANCRQVISNSQSKE
jgi:hypothetical protein